MSLTTHDRAPRQSTAAVLRTGFSLAVLFASLLPTSTAVQARTAVLIDILSSDQDLEASSNFYGEHVVANGKWLFVGAPRESIDLDSSGAIGAGERGVGALYVYRHTADGLVLHQKLTGAGRFDGAVTADRFGTGLASSGDWLFVSAANAGDFGDAIDPNPNPGAPDFVFAGKTFVFRFNKHTVLWEGPVQVLTSDEPLTDGGFGGRTDSGHVALFTFGDRNPKVALIGECCGANVQKLHVFKRHGNRWDRVRIVGSPTGSTTSMFADKVVAAGKYALVSETDVSVPGVAEPYAVHVYKVTGSGIQRSSPVQTLRPLNPIDPAVCSFGFGSGGLAAWDDVAVIADACDSSQGIEEAGVINVYEVTGGAAAVRFRQQLFHPNPQAFFRLGLTLGPGQQGASTNGELIAVGANTAAAGEVLLFERVGGGGKNFGSFAFLETLTNPNPDPAAILLSFGQSVLLFDDHLTVDEFNVGSPIGGRVFVYEIQ